MCLGKNITNAVEVLQNTYDSIDKLIDCVQTIAVRSSDYLPAVSKFLRYKSDNNTEGWMIHYFILLFQNKIDEELPNRWRNGPIFVMEIDLDGGLHKVGEPLVLLSRFDYSSIRSWSPGCSPTNCWRFHWPLCHESMEHKPEGVLYYHTAKSGYEDDVDADYWGLKRAITLQFPLVELNADNVKEKIFGGFEKLKQLT